MRVDKRKRRKASLVHGAQAQSGISRSDLPSDEPRRPGDDPAQWKTLRRGWCLGDEQFRAELPGQMSGKPGVPHGGSERQETAEAKRILAGEFRRRGWDVEALNQRRKRDAEKIQMARRL